MSVELFLIIAFAIIGVILAAWVTLLSCVVDDLRVEAHNLRALLAYKRKNKALEDGKP